MKNVNKNAFADAEKLTRNQLKEIMGGNKPIGGSNPSCRAGKCDLYVEALGKHLEGTCTFHNTGDYSWTCVCQAQGYETNNGGNTCNYD